MCVSAAKNNVWVYDIDRASATRVTAGRYHAPMWTRDGRLVVSKGPPAHHDLVLRPADVEGPEETLLPWDRPQFGGGWTADGRLVLEREGDGDAFDIVALDLATRAGHRRGGHTGLRRASARVARRAMAGLPVERQRPPRGVRAWAGAWRRPATRVDQRRGRHRLGARRPDRVLHQRRGSRHVGVARDHDAGLTVGPPARMFGIEPYIGEFDVSPDGKRFVMAQRGPLPPRNRLELVQNALSAVPGAR